MVGVMRWPLLLVLEVERSVVVLAFFFLLPPLGLGGRLVEHDEAATGGAWEKMEERRWMKAFIMIAVMMMRRDKKVSDGGYQKRMEKGIVEVVGAGRSVSAW